MFCGYSEWRLGARFCMAKPELIVGGFEVPLLVRASNALTQLATRTSEAGTLTSGREKISR
jgi:hypothetical protein